MEDLAGMYKRLKFGGIKILAVHEGQVNTVLVGLRGRVGQLMREDNVEKVRRGMTGLISRGLSAGGLAYGYRVNPEKKGEFLVVPEQAAIVKEIFERYVAGQSPRKIAYDLNDRGVPPPAREVRSGTPRPSTARPTAAAASCTTSSMSGSTSGTRTSW